jgi:hypothetical protein
MWATTGGTLRRPACKLSITRADRNTCVHPDSDARNDSDSDARNHSDGDAGIDSNSDSRNNSGRSGALSFNNSGRRRPLPRHFSVGRRIRGSADLEQQICQRIFGEL